MSQAVAVDGDHMAYDLIHVFRVGDIITKEFFIKAIVSAKLVQVSANKFCGKVRLDVTVYNAFALGGLVDTLFSGKVITDKIKVNLCLIRNLSHSGVIKDHCID